MNFAPLRQRVLLVDANIDDSTRLSLTLQLAGHIVIVAAGLSAAMVAMRCFKPCLVILRDGTHSASDMRGMLLGTQTCDETVRFAAVAGTAAQSRLHADDGFGVAVVWPLNLDAIASLLAA